MKLLRKLFTLFRRRKRDTEMTEEMRHHVELQTESNVKAGINPDEARYAALRQFGNVAVIQEQVRERRGWIGLCRFGKDIRLATRRLYRSPGFTVTALLTLAICIGANLAIFALVDSILLRPLPFPESDRLVTVFNSYPQAGVNRDGSSVTNYYERRGHIPAFSSLALYRSSPAIVGEANLARRVQVMQVSPEFFSVLGRGPVLGRTFTEAETTFQTSQVVILSDTAWRQYFDSDPHVIGRQLTINGGRKTVIGVLPPDFRFLSFASRLYLPIVTAPAARTPGERHSGGNVTQMIARLSPGADLRMAQAQIDAHNAAMEADDPKAKQMRDAGFRSIVVPLHADHVGAIRPTLWLMQAGGLFLLLIGAVNLVNLLLIRASARARELAVRQALGAGRWNMVSEVLAETLLLTLVGGLLGLGVGAAGIHLLAILGADKLPLGAYVAFDVRLAILTMGGALALGLTISFPIVWFNMHDHQIGALQSSGRGSTSGRGVQRVRHGFIVVQLALAFVLLVGAGQLGMSFKKSLEVFPGFRPANVLSAKIWVPPASASDLPSLIGVTEKAVEEVDRQPGVIAAGMITNIPFSGLSGKSAATIKDLVIPAGESPRGNYSYSVMGDYFKAMDFSLHEGRFLTMDDSRRADRVCVVDDDFARHYWPTGGALGHRLYEGSQQGPDNEAYTIVGVVGAVKQAGLTDKETPGAVYYPLGHRPDRDVYLVVRTSLAPEIFGSTLKNVVARVDSKLPVSELRTMKSRIGDSLAVQRSPAVLSSIFAGVALLLAGIGTYGVLSYAVAQRCREIGIRVALGALPNQITRHFLSTGFGLLLVAAIIGTVGAWFAGRAMKSVLFEVSSFPIEIWGGTAIALTCVTFLACFLPARRASRVDPVVALKSE